MKFVSVVAVLCFAVLIPAFEAASVSSENKVEKTINDATKSIDAAISQIEELAKNKVDVALKKIAEALEGVDKSVDEVLDELKDIIKEYVKNAEDLIDQVVSNGKDKKDVEEAKKFVQDSLTAAYKTINEAEKDANNVLLNASDDVNAAVNEAALAVVLASNMAKDEFDNILKEVLKKIQEAEWKDNKEENIKTATKEIEDIIASAKATLQKVLNNMIASLEKPLMSGDKVTQGLVATIKTDVREAKSDLQDLVKYTQQIFK